jgi:hypothetical protein
LCCECEPNAPLPKERSEAKRTVTRFRIAASSSWHRQTRMCFVYPML